MVADMKKPEPPPHWRKTVGVRLRPDLAERLADAEAATGMSTRELIESCLDAHLPVIIAEKIQAQQKLIAKVKRSLK